MKKKIIFITFQISIVLCFLFDCNSIFAQVKPEIMTKKFTQIGYQTKSKENQTPSDWEKEQFQMLSKTVYKVKRITPLKGSQKMYPRFEVTEEVYENEENAKLRAARIREKPPNLPIEREEYWMVSGFRHKNIIYFTSTDAVLFYEGIGEFMQKFQNVIKR